jgi:ATP-dependent Clp protease ATP-binding subunit ClpB
VLPLHLMAALLEDRRACVPVLEKVGVPVEQLLAG